MDDQVDELLDSLRQAAATTPRPAAGEALAALFREGTAPVGSPPPVRSRRRSALRVAVAGAVAGTAVSGLGIAGALPAPVQHGVARVVVHVGVHLPDDARATTTSTTAPTTTTLRPTTTTAAPLRPVTTSTSVTPSHEDASGAGGEDANADNRGSGGGNAPTTQPEHNENSEHRSSDERHTDDSHGGHDQ